MNRVASSALVRWVCLLSALAGAGFVGASVQRLDLPNGGFVIAWTEQQSSGARAYYAYSPDGVTIGRAIETDHVLKLRYGAFDPLVETPQVDVALQAPPTNETYIVQFVAPPFEPFQQVMVALGGEVYSPLPSHALAARLSPQAVETLLRQPCVRWIGPFHPAYKLDESILAQLSAGAAAGPAMRYSIECFARGPAQQTAVANAIASMGGRVHFISEDGFRMEATLTLAQVVEVAQMSEVHFVDRWGPAGADMDLVRQVVGAVPVLLNAGFTGQGVRGEIFDTEVQANHPEWNGQAPLVHGVNGNSGTHGTPSYGINFSTGVVNAQSTGICPSREQGIFCWYTQATQFGGQLTRLQMNTEAVDPNGPYRSCYQSAAVGSPQTTQYTTISAEVDDYLFQLDYLSFQAMSNTGNNNSRPQAWAKNILSVGGVELKETVTKSDDAMSNADFGPAADGRVKPDLVNAYTGVFTTTTSSGYTNFAGASAANPITAGCGGLVLQMWHAGVWKNHGGKATVFDSRPKSTTAKALLINTSYKYPLTQNGLTRARQGWGIAHVGLAYTSRDNTYVNDQQHILAPGGVNTYFFDVPAGTGELAVTMSYPDPKGPTSATLHRINDVSLRVTSPGGTIYWGNNGLDSSNYSSPGGVSNKIDTVENVFVAEPPAGMWKVEVFGDEIVQDGYLATPQMDAIYSLVFRGKNTAAVGCPGDITLDGKVDQADLGVLLAAYGTTVGQPGYNGQADLNVDGGIDQADLGLLLAAYGSSCG